MMRAAAVVAVALAAQTTVAHASAEPSPPASSPPPPPPPGTLDVYGFVDAYVGVNYNFPKPQAPVSTNVGGSGFRAYDTAEGFALHWLGVDATYAADAVGGTIGLRLGPGATRYDAGQDGAYGLGLVKQAYATWKPTSALTLDFGKWDQPFGSEVADSQSNISYTRSLLYWYAQPLFFTGLRAGIAFGEALGATVFVANGWNESVDVNRGKTAGVQLVVRPSDTLALYVGYAGGPEQPDFVEAAPGGVADVSRGNTNLRQLVDFVADFNPSPSLRLLFNADYGREDGVAGSATSTATHRAVWYGANLAVRYAFTEQLYAALRGEVFRDRRGDLLATGQPTTLEDATVTLAYSVGRRLSLMLDHRVDVALRDVFQVGATGLARIQATTTLGVIASTK